MTIDVGELRSKVQNVYREVAERPFAGFHFEVGRALAERLGYDPQILNSVPAEVVDSFAGVGCPFELASLTEGEDVLDLGSGSGMDSFFAALLTGSEGSVIGVDMTEEQLQKANRAASDAGFSNVVFRKGFIESLPLAAESVDLVISNGVINLASDKSTVFAEIARVLRPGGRMAVADIVSERQLTENIVCDTGLWAACIGGASQEDRYRESIEGSGLRVKSLAENSSYAFLSKSAQNASTEFGVKSITLLAEKPAP